MQTQAIQNCYHILEKLKIYQLHQNSFIDAELAAYNVAFQLVEESLTNLQHSAFIQTADEEALARYEKLLEMPTSNSSLSIRRTLIINRLAVAPYDFTSQTIYHSVKACGIDAVIYEMPFQEKITIQILEYINPDINLEYLQNSLEKMLPAHLEWTFDYGILTWDMLEHQVSSWNFWDEKDFLWNDFDKDGDQIFI